MLRSKEKSKTKASSKKEFEGYAFPMKLESQGITITSGPIKKEKAKKSKERWYENRTIQAALIGGFIGGLFVLLGILLSSIL